mmetsp:Transcript_25057/g.62668  ORF Transcript_25057/g.62668 Transcript_25057/m.62668 type:complete len:261 (+) Transcript_25057:789-1571(+)
MRRSISRRRRCSARARAASSASFAAAHSASRSSRISFASRRARHPRAYLCNTRVFSSLSAWCCSDVVYVPLPTCTSRDSSSSRSGRCICVLASRLVWMVRDRSSMVWVSRVNLKSVFHPRGFTSVCTCACRYSTRVFLFRKPPRYGSLRTCETSIGMFKIRGWLVVSNGGSSTSMESGIWPGMTLAPTLAWLCLCCLYSTTSSSCTASPGLMPTSVSRISSESGSPLNLSDSVATGSGSSPATASLTSAPVMPARSCMAC